MGSSQPFQLYLGFHWRYFPENTSHFSRMRYKHYNFTFLCRNMEWSCCYFMYCKCV